jgi:hypothetical protein
MGGPEQLKSYPVYQPAYQGCLGSRPRRRLTGQPRCRLGAVSDPADMDRSETWKAKSAHLRDGWREKRRQGDYHRRT